MPGPASPIWCMPRTNGMACRRCGCGGGAGRAAAPAVGPNRGVAVLGDRLFYISDDAYLVCLNRLTGAVMWSESLAETSREGQDLHLRRLLVVNDLVIAGIAGGDSPMRGFLVAYQAETRQAGLALLHHSQAGRAPVRNLDRPRAGNRRRRHLGNRLL